MMLEFALSFVLFWTVLLAVIEFSSLMLVWGLAGEASRQANRLAAICDSGVVQQAAIRNRVAPLLRASGLVSLPSDGSWLAISYYPTGCIAANNCQFVETSLRGLTIKLAVPQLEDRFTLPDFRSRSVREAMRNVIKGETNAECG